MWGGTDQNDPVGAIHAAIDHGINLIDTAPIYGYGHSEGVVGEAIKHRRDQVVLATNCGLNWWSEEGDKFFESDEHGRAEDEVKYKVYKNLRPKEIRYEIEQSLKRLQTDRIDLYQTHWQDRPGCTHALVGARSAEQAVANAKAGEIELTPSELKALRSAVEATGA
jgi:methylglyoxal reductase